MQPEHADTPAPKSEGTATTGPLAGDASSPPKDTAADPVAQLIIDGVRLHNAGTILYPLKRDKKAAGKWALGERNWVQQPADVDQVVEWAKKPDIVGWLSLNGNRDRSHVVIDAEKEGMDYPEILGIFNQLPDYCQRATRSGIGRHAFIRITDGDPAPTEHVARRNGVLLIETRGVSKGDKNGSYAVVTGPGRPPLADDFAWHPMTRAEYERLLKPARGLHAPTDRERKIAENTKAGKVRSTGAGSGTGKVIADAVAAGRLSWVDHILEPGWTVTSDSGGRVGLLRPDGGNPSTADESGNVVDQVLVVHSGSVDWATPGEGYNAPRAYALCWHDGDYATAMKTLEGAARALVDDGEMPTDHLAAWPTDVLIDIHSQRCADAKAYREERGDDPFMDLTGRDGKPTNPDTAATSEEAPVTDDTTDGDERPKLTVVSFTDIAPRQVAWIEPGLLPAGEVIVTVGEEGIGKGLWWVNRVARLTTRPDPIDVLVIVAEDDPSTVVRPRLDVAGADIARVHLLTVDPETLTGVPIIPGQTDLVRQHIEATGARLVIIDPWMSVLPGGLQVKDTQQARRALDPVTRLARETGAAIMLVTHTNRATTSSARGMYGATVGLRQAARMCLMVLEDPSDDTVLYVGVEKSNLAAKGPAVRYVKRDAGAAWAAQESDDDVGLTIAELVALFTKDGDDRVTDKWTDVVLTAAKTEGIITRSQIIGIYDPDPANPSKSAQKSADKAIGRWKNSDPPRLVAVPGLRGGYEVVGASVAKPPTEHPDTHFSYMGGKGRKEEGTPHTPRETNAGSDVPDGGFAGASTDADGFNTTPLDLLFGDDGQASA